VWVAPGRTAATTIAIVFVAVLAAGRCADQPQSPGQRQGARAQHRKRAGERCRPRREKRHQMMSFPSEVQATLTERRAMMPKLAAFEGYYAPHARNTLHDNADGELLAHLINDENLVNYLVGLSPRGDSGILRIRIRLQPSLLLLVGRGFQLSTTGHHRATTTKLTAPRVPRPHLEARRER